MPIWLSSGAQPLYGAPLCSLYWNVTDESSLVRIIWNVLLPPVLQNVMLSYSTMKLSIPLDQYQTEPLGDIESQVKSLSNGANWLFGLNVLGTGWNGDAFAAASPNVM